MDARALRLESGSAPKLSKDPAAELLESTLSFALRSRLRQHEHVAVAADVTGMGLLGGRFEGLEISGRRWKTPLGLTADRVTVIVGKLDIDYGALAMGQVALRNTPSGSARIGLNAHDLGAFLLHPLMAQVSRTAVKGLPFCWDRDHVSIGLGSGANPGGWVKCEGVWMGDGRRYRMLMTLVPGAGVTSAERIKVVAEVSEEDGARSFATADSTDSLPSPLGTGQLKSARTLEAEAAVASGLRDMFVNLLLDLQGIELRHPQLAVGQPSAGASGAGPLLNITMDLEMKAIPPLNMSF